MHLGIDIREACRTRRAGKGQWTYGFVRELLRRDIRLTLFTDADLPPEWADAIASAGDRVRTACIPLSGLRWHFKAASMVRSMDVDAYVSTVSYIVPFLVGRKKRVIPVVHDLIAFLGEPHDRRATFIERVTLGRAVGTAALTCTVSDSSRNDLLARFPSLPPASVIPVYAASMLEPKDADPKRDSILCIATLCPRKNQLGLIHAYAALPQALRDAHPLILVGGRGWNDDEIIRMAESTPGVSWLKYQSDEECRTLYARAAVFAYPSFYEGFGMPVLDAFAAGIPVLTSDRGSLKEVAGDAALTADPSDTAALSSALESLLSNEHLRLRLRDAGFARLKAYSWPQTVDRFLTAVDKVL